MILEIRRGRAKNCSRPISEPVFLVGSNDDCDMVLGDRQFPPIHFYVIRDGNRVVLRKIGLSPDVSINGEPTTSTALEDGDRIRTGPYEFIVRAA